MASTDSDETSLDRALVIGIDQYPSLPEANRSLPGAREDALRFYAWVTGPGGVHRDNAVKILPPTPSIASDPRPTEYEIEKFFKRFDPRKEKPLRRLYVYAAGHGSVLARKRDEDRVLLTASASMMFVDHVALLMYARRLLEAGAFKELVFFADVCSLYTHDITPREPPMMRLDAHDNPRQAVWFSAPLGQPAWESKDANGQSGGEFTRVLLAGLEGQAAGSDGRITPHTLNEYLKMNVAQAGFDEPHIHPYTVADDLVIARVDRRGPPLEVAFVDASSTRGAEFDRAMKEVGVRLERSVPSHAPLTVELDDPKSTDRTMHVRYGSAGAESVTDSVDPRDPVDLARFARVLHEAVDRRGAALTVDADVPYARVRVARVRPGGALGQVHEGWGSVSLDGAAPGPYRVEVEVGRYRSDETYLHGGVTASRHRVSIKLDVPYFASDSPREGELVLEAELGSVSSEAPAVEVRLRSENDERPQRVEWTRDGTRLCARVDVGEHEVHVVAPTGQDSTSDASVFRPLGVLSRGGRLLLAKPDLDVVASLAEALFLFGADEPTKSIVLLQEAVARGRPLDDPARAGPPALSSSPSEALLRGALALTADDADSSAHTTRLAQLLGHDDPDVAALSGRVPRGGVLPRLTASWRALAERWAQDTNLDAATALLAPTATPVDTRQHGRRFAAQPWFLAETSAKRIVDLPRLADVLWPGWRSDPIEAPPVFAVDAAEVVRAFERPIPVIREAIYKQPPVADLVAHDVITFVGASNDQLAAALAAAFILRGRRKWPRLDLLFLTDESLGELLSNGRRGSILVDAKKRALRELRALIPRVAAEHTFLEYDRWYYFASAWDLPTKRGWMHISPCLPGEDVRGAPSLTIRARENLDELTTQLDTLRKRARPIVFDAAE